MKARVLYLIDTLETVGGTERHLFEVTRRLKEGGRYEPIVFSLGPRGPFSMAMAEAGIEVHDLDIRRVYGSDGFRVFSQLKQEVRRRDVRLVHAFHFAAQIMGTALAKATGRPLVVSVRDLGFWQKGHHRLACRMLNPFARRILANSNAIAEDLVKKGVPKEKIRVVYNGVDLAKFSDFDKERFRRENNVQPGIPVVGYLGWLRPEKGVGIFLGAAAEVVKAGRKVEFWVVGDGPLRAALGQDAHRLGIESCVRFWGERRDASQLLSLMDICVLPSETEGFSNTLIEAMAAGTAAIASRIGGNPEAVEEGKTGLLVPSGDSRAFCAAMIKLLDDEPLRRQMGQNARQRVAEKFDIRQVALQYERVYDELLIS